VNTVQVNNYFVDSNIYVGVEMKSRDVNTFPSHERIRDEWSNTPPSLLSKLSFLGLIANIPTPQVYRFALNVFEST